jgi:hypothetical protein
LNESGQGTALPEARFSAMACQCANVARRLNGSLRRPLSVKAAANSLRQDRGAIRHPQADRPVFSLPRSIPADSRGIRRRGPSASEMAGGGNWSGSATAVGRGCWNTEAAFSRKRLRAAGPRDVIVRSVRPCRRHGTRAVKREPSCPGGFAAARAAGLYSRSWEGGERSGGDDGARTRDLRRDRPAF